MLALLFTHTLVITTGSFSFQLFHGDTNESIQNTIQHLMSSPSQVTGLLRTKCRFLQDRVPPLVGILFIKDSSKENDYNGIHDSLKTSTQRKFPSFLEDLLPCFFVGMHKNFDI